MKHEPEAIPTQAEAEDSLLTRFVGGALSVGLGNLSTMFFGLIGVMVIARLLPATVFGSFVLLQVIASFLTRVSSLGLNLSIQKFVAGIEDLDERRKLINTSLFFRVLTIAATCGLALMVKPLLTTLFQATTVETLFGAILVLYVLESLGQFLRATLQGLFRFQAVAICDLSSSIVGFVLLLFFVLYLKLGLWGLVYAKGLAMTSAVVIALISIPDRLRVEIDFGRLRQLLSFGMPLQASDILTFVFLRVDTLMIGAFLGPAEIAYYEIARKIPESLGGFYEAFRSVFLSFIARLYALGERTEAAEMVNHSNRLISLVVMFGSLIALLFGEEIITLLFSQAYLTSVPVFVLLMIGLNISIIDYTLGYSLVAVDETKKTVVINAILATASLLGSRLLIPPFGTVGAASARLIGFVVANPFYIIFLRPKLNVVAWPYLKPILLFALCWLVTFFWPPNLVGSLLLLVGFGVASWFATVITRTDLSTVVAEAAIIRSKLLHLSRTYSG